MILCYNLLLTSNCVKIATNRNSRKEKKMAKNRPRTDRDLHDFSVRRTKRMSQQGRLLEDEVEAVLSQLQNQGKILSFTRHSANSPADCDGRDFTVTTTQSGGNRQYSFGVTISLRSWQKARVKHPQVPQLCWPIGTKPETMAKRILELLSTNNPSA